VKDVPPTAAEATARRWRVWPPPRWLLWSMAASGAVSTVVGTGVGLLVWRLSQGPIDLAPMAEGVRSGIGQSIGSGYRVDMGPIELAWVEGAPRVSLRDLRIVRDDGALVASAPAATVDVSLFGLLRGDVQPTALSVRGGVVALTVRTDGSLVLGGPDPAQERGRPTPILALADPELFGRGFGAHAPVPAHGTIDLLTLQGIKVTLRDERSGIVRAFDPFDVTFARRSTDAFQAALTVPSRAGGWRALAEVGAPAGGIRQIRLRVSELSPADLSGESMGALDPLRLALTVEGRMEVSGAIDRLEGVLALSGAATLDLDGTPIDIREQTVSFAFRPSQRLVEIVPSSVGVSGVGGRLSGRLVMPALGDPTRPIRFDLWLDQLVVDAQGRTVPELERITASGALEQTTRTLWLDRLEGHAGRQSVSARGQVIFVGPTPGVRLEASADMISADTIRRVWPVFIVPDAQDWFHENVVAGTLERGELMLQVPPGYLDGRPLLRDMFRGAWRFRDASVRLSPDLPPITGVSGLAQSTATSLRVQASDGAMELPAGRLRFPSISYLAEEMHLDAAAGVLEARAVGEAGVLLALGATQGIAIAGEGGLDPRAVTGDASATIRVVIPLRSEADPPQVETSIDAEFRDVAGKGLIEGRDLERGTFRLQASSQGGVTAEGTATVAGLSARLSARQEPNSRRLIVRAEVDTDDAMRARLGFDFAPFLTGPATVRLIRDGVGADVTRKLEVELGQARVSIPQLMFDKPRGTPATLSMVLRGQPKVTGLDDVQFRGRGFAVRGRLRLDEGGQPTLAEFSEFRLRGDDQLAVRIEREDRRLAVRVTGRQVDVRPYLQRLMADEEGDPPESRLELSVRVDRAVGHGTTTVNDLRLDATRQGPRLTEFTLAGAFQGAARIAGEILQDQNRPYLFISSTDGGAVLRFLDLYRNMRGGRLTFTHTLTDPTGRRAQGVAMIDDFRVVGERALERLTAAAPAVDEGGRQRRLQLQPNDVQFDRMRVMFQRSPGVTQMTEGVLRNPLIGMTFEGQFNWRRQTMDLKGVFIPAFALNNFFAQIPVVGAFLGGRNEGLLGVTYAVQGPMANPTLQVNPASAVAPGIFRHMFSFPDPSGTVRAPPPDMAGPSGGGN
jgi:hypothetical protein